MTKMESRTARTGPAGATERLTEAFWDRYRRLQQAVAADDTPLVDRLDREMVSSLKTLVDHQAGDAAEQHAQFTALLRVLREGADDACLVRINADLIESLLRRYITVRTRPADSNGLPSVSDPILNGALDVGQLDRLAERVSVVTTDYRYLYANVADAAHLGRKPHELMGRHLRDVVGPERFDARIKTNLDRCFSGEIVEHTNARETGGKVVVIRRRLTPCYAEGERLVGALVVIQEGPDRRQRNG